MAVTQLGVIFASLCGLTADTTYRMRAGKLTIEPRHPHKTTKLPVDPELCPCKAFTYCDLIYQTMPAWLNDRWKAAIKTRHRSAYDLWMGECLTLVNAGKAPPDIPSASGGFTANAAQPGETYPGLAICGWTPPVIPDIPWPPGPPCEHCVLDTPSKVTVDIFEMTGDYASLNGQYVIPQIEDMPCLYYIVRDEYEIDFNFQDMMDWFGYITNDEHTTYISFQRSPAPADCYAPTALPWESDSGDIGDQTSAYFSVSGYQP